MNTVYNIMNAGNETPILSKEELMNYPSLGEVELGYMERKALSTSEFVYIFPLVRESTLKNKYVDIYIFDSSISYKERFVLAPGFKLQNEKEERLEEKLKSKCISYVFLEKGCLEEIKKMSAPYLDNVSVVSHILLGYYFISFKAGLRELLFKCGLDYLSFNIECFEEINLMATTAEELFEMPLKALRLFNNSDMYMGLKSHTDRMIKARTYTFFSSYLCSEETLTEAQWDYLFKARRYERDQKTHGYGVKFNRSVFAQLAKVKDNSYADMYLEYIELKACLGYRVWDNHLPSLEDIEDELGIIRERYRFESSREYIDEGLGFYYKETCIYEYQNSNYRVWIPKKLDDFLEMADWMRNCIADYAFDVASGEAMILFVDIKDENNRLNLEFNGHEIVEARRRFNERITDKDEAFLEEYCNVYGLELCI